jgi:putative Holliday junction resolvase
LGRLLGVDLGSRRVGLALSDPGRLISSPLATLAYSGDKQLIGKLLALVSEHDVDTVVVGLPLLEDGSEGPGCRRAHDFADRLRRRGVAVELWDERWSSRRAEELLREGGISRRRGLHKIDKIAASLILEDYMNSTQQKDEHT